MKDTSQWNRKTGVGFLSCFYQLVSQDTLHRLTRSYGPLKRRPAEHSASCIMAALVYHFFQSQGYLSTHYQLIWKKRLSDAALSKRRLTMPWEVFEELLRAALKPLADIKLHPESFYQGLRLVAIDGTEFSVANTPQVLGQLTKATSRRFQAAFAKIGICVLVEVGQHNPIAAAIGDKGNCELALAKNLWDQLPKCCLLLADRAYGTAWTIGQLLERLKAQKGHCLIRVRSNLKMKFLKALSDGSALVEMGVRDREKPRQTRQTLLLREIRGLVRKPGMAQAAEVRLWTTLLDEKSHPARVLLELYIKRWEQELYYHQLKIDVRSCDMLQSHTVHTAAQELAALVLASALLARQRLQCADQAQVETLRISFAKVLESTRALWYVLEIGQEIVTPQQACKLVKANMDDMVQSCLLTPRRKRSCPRAVRQPVQKWPRLIQNQSHNGPAIYEISPVTTSIS